MSIGDYERFNQEDKECEYVDLEESHFCLNFCEGSCLCDDAYCIIERKRLGKDV